MRPMVVLSRTLLPVPEGPKIANISPRSMVRSTPASTGWSKAFRMPTYWISGTAAPPVVLVIGSVEHQRGEERVQDEHGERHEHHRGRGRASHSLRASARLQTHVRGDEGDREAEHGRLGERV